jgi:hypothetical protein
MNDRLVRASRLEVVKADQLHVVRFGALLGGNAAIARDGERGERDRDRGGRQVRASHAMPLSRTATDPASD